jgi:hypothetical protein
MQQQSLVLRATNLKFWCRCQPIQNDPASVEIEDGIAEQLTAFQDRPPLFASTWIDYTTHKPDKDWLYHPFRP